MRIYVNGRTPAEFFKKGINKAGGKVKEWGGSAVVGSIFWSVGDLPSTAQRLVPLIDKMTDFGLGIGIVIALWHGMRWLMGDPSAKDRIWQTLIGYIGLFVIPWIFIEIYRIFH